MKPDSRYAALSLKQGHPEQYVPALLILSFMLQVITGFLTYEHTLTFDEAMWQYIGRNWFHLGLTPYTGGVDNKSPLIFAVYGLSDKLFGVNYWFPRLLGVSLQTIGLYYVYKIARHIFSEQAGLLALIVYGFSLTWHSTGGKYVSYTESFSIAFVIMSVYYAVASDQNKFFFLGGILAGLGFLFNIFAFFGIFAIVLYLLLKKLNKAFIFLGGFLISVFIISVSLSIAGIRFHDIMLFALFDNFGAGSVTDHALDWKLNNFFNHFFYSDLVILLPGLIGYFFIKKRNGLFLLWFICDFIGLIVIGTFSLQHFKNILPSLSLMNALSLAYLVDTYALPVKPVLIMAWICFFPKLLEPLISFRDLAIFSKKKTNPENNSDYNQEDDYTKRKLGLWIKSNTTPGTPVFIAGYSAIAQAYSERSSPSIYFNTTQTQLAKRIFFNDMNLHKPAMICVPTFDNYTLTVASDIRDSINQLTSRRYYLKRNIYGYAIYIKKNNAD